MAYNNTSLRLDYYEGGQWKTFIHAHAKQSASKTWLVDLEGFIEPPTIIRNQATPLFSDGIVQSRLSHINPRYITTEITKEFATVKDADDFRYKLSNLPIQQRNNNMYLFLIDWQNGVQIRHHKLEVKCDEEFINSYKQKGRVINMTLSFIAPKPLYETIEGIVI